MKDMFLLKEDGFGPVYIRAAALGSIRVLPQSLRQRPGEDVEIRYLSGGRDCITDADWAKIAPLILAEPGQESASHVRELEAENERLRERIHQLEMAVNQDFDQTIRQDMAELMQPPADPSPPPHQPAPLKPDENSGSTLVNIIRVERSSFYSKTAGKRCPMWRLFTDDGRQCNAFDHTDPLRDHKPLLIEAGYLDTFMAMGEGESRAWSATPIQAQLMPEGQFWKLVSVVMRGADDGPDDEPDVEDLTLEQLNVCREAKALLARDDLVVFDCETTGLDTDDEVVEIAIVDAKSGALYHTLIKPQTMPNLMRPGKKGLTSVDIHGITEAMLKDAPTMDDPAVIKLITEHMHHKTWAAFNIPFDMRLLTQSWGIADVSATFPEPTETGCVQRLMNRYLGRQYASLGDSCRALNITRSEAHRATADAVDALAVLKALAAKVPDEQRMMPIPSGGVMPHSEDIPF